MPNIDDLNGVVFRFELYNLNYFQESPVVISGHYTFWWHKPGNHYVFCKHGDYHNLVSFRPIKEDPRFPTTVEQSVLAELIDDVIQHAYFYDGATPCNHGRYLLDDLELRCDKKNGRGTEWFKHDYDEYFDYVDKHNCVFAVDYPGPDYAADGGYWSELKRKDTLAIKLLNEKYQEASSSNSADGRADKHDGISCTGL